MNTIADVLDAKGTTIHTIEPTAMIQQAVVRMCHHKVGALLVRTPDGATAGILSERDLMVRVLLDSRDPLTTPVADIMTSNVVTIEAGETVGRAMEVMTRVRCRHLPVTKNGKVIGLVSVGDLVRDVISDQAYELRLIHEYVEGRYPG